MGREDCGRGRADYCVGSTGLRIRYKFWGNFCCRGVRIWKGSSRKVLLEDERVVEKHSDGVVGLLSDYIPFLVSMDGANHTRKVIKSPLRVNLG